MLIYLYMFLYIFLYIVNINCYKLLYIAITCYKSVFSYYNHIQPNYLYVCRTSKWIYRGLELLSQRKHKKVKHWSSSICIGPYTELAYRLPIVLVILSLRWSRHNLTGHMVCLASEFLVGSGPGVHVAPI